MNQKQQHHIDRDIYYARARVQARTQRLLSRHPGQGRDPENVDSRQRHSGMTNCGEVRVGGSTGLISRVKIYLVGMAFILVLSWVMSGCVTSREVVKKPDPIEIGRFDDLDETMAIEIKRTNPSNGNFELLRLDQEKLILSRNINNFKKTLNVDPDTLKILDKKIREMGEIKVFPFENAQTVQIMITVYGNKMERSLTLDPKDELQPVYVEFMKLRNEVLARGQ